MILKNYTTFKELIEFLNSFSDIKIELSSNVEHLGIKFVGKDLPISINEHEFNFMHDFIVKHNLKNGIFFRLLPFK